MYIVKNLRPIPALPLTIGIRQQTEWNEIYRSHYLDLCTKKAKEHTEKTGQTTSITQTVAVYSSQASYEVVCDYKA